MNGPLRSQLGATTSRTRTRAYRQRLRDQGLRPVQLWLPDTRSAAFQAEARRQCNLVTAGTKESDDQAFIDAVSVDWDGP